MQYTNISSAKVWKKPPPNRSIQLHKVNNQAGRGGGGKLREFSSSQLMCTVVIVSSLKGRAHSKARLRTIVTWNALDSNWLETRYAPYLPPEPQVPCLSKCPVIKSHYDDLLMVSFFPLYMYARAYVSIWTRSRYAPDI